MSRLHHVPFPPYQQVENETLQMYSTPVHQQTFTLYTYTMNPAFVFGQSQLRILEVPPHENLWHLDNAQWKHRDAGKNNATPTNSPSKSLSLTITPF